MDTSKKYILMCEKAGEIQEQRHIATDWQKGDWFLRAGTPWIDVVSHQSAFSNLPIPVRTVWLPRQDQLQDMLLTPLGAKDLLEDFWGWIDCGDAGLDAEFEYSFEMLWLAFAMKQKYNKLWDGRVWIREKTKRRTIMVNKEVKVTKGKHGETRELKLGEIEIVSHVYYGYQRLHLKMKNCSLLVKPRSVDVDGDENTGMSITVEKGYPIIKHEEKYLWLKIYQKRKTRGTYAGREWEVLDVIMVCPKCHKLMRQTQWLEATDPKTKEVETTYWWTCFNCNYCKTEVVTSN